MKLQKARRRTDGSRGSYVWPLGAVVGLLGLSLIAYGEGKLHGEHSGPERMQASGDSGMRFTDARRQAEEFIGYDRSIVLTREQREVMEEALSAIPAPCCAQYSIATCCCPCNLARSTWGLAKRLITREHATVTQVRAVASEWLRFSNPAGYTGDACFTKGCERAFDRNGCGGMDEQHVR